jgi:hypothetical protein
VIPGDSGVPFPRPDGRWFDCLPSCQAQVPCGQGRHAVRWEAGSLVLTEHPDAEGELVLAALGGEKAGCVELAEAWGRHTADLSMLAIGPRGPADEIAVSWEDVADAGRSDQGARIRQAGPGTGRPQLGPMQPGPMRPGPMRAARPMSRPALTGRRLGPAQEVVDQARRRRNDILSLLALGYGFQLRLIGHVAAAHADRPGERVRPALVAAITGRLAPAAGQWLGIEPDQVAVSLHQGPGWGSTELTGHGRQRRLRVSLPAGWLASVWTCGLALAGQHLVVAVKQAGWPDARVLGLRSPGAEPVLLDVHASADARGGPADAPHWEM